MAETSRLHIVMFPWNAAGHMTPFLHLANELASRGHRITYLLPKKALNQLQQLNLYPNLISFQILSVPHVDGLSPGTETASEIPISSTPFLAVARDLARDQVEEKLRSLKPDYIVFDFAHWVPKIARSLGIKSVHYCVVSAASLAIAVVPARNVSKDRPLTEEELREPPSGYPSPTVVLRGHEVRALLFISLPFGDGVNFYERNLIGMRESDAISIRTCEEIEGELCNYIAEQFGKRVLLTGPILTDPDGKTPLEEKWGSFLGKFKPKSVVFCAFGSQLILQKGQFEELLLGFEKTGLPFFIAVKPPMGCETVEEAFPEGFEERVRERGIVCGGWVNQPLILDHQSVGCFVNHCGFGSMWESLMSKCQIVLVPHLGDQILNTRLLADELKVAVEVEKDENGWFTKENLSKAIETVMDEKSEICQVLKKNHTKWREILVEPGFMSGYIDKFVQNLQEI